MRTTLFLSTLCAMSLFGGLASAEKPGQGHPAREPRAIETLRTHGDTVDKAYRTPSPGAMRAATNVDRGELPALETRPSTRHEARGSERVNCSDSGADCSRSSGPAIMSRTSPDAGSLKAQGSSKLLSNKQAQERANCSEGDECNASSKAGGSVWASRGGQPGLKLPSFDKSPRTRDQASEARMSCNEGEECSFSSKEAKKIWSYEAVKAGTFSGPKSERDAARVAADKARTDKTKDTVRDTKDTTSHEAEANPQH